VLVINIDVTWADMENAGLNSHSCPVARALHRQGYPDATVGRTVWFPNGTGRYDSPSLPLSSETRLWINRWDTRGMNEPATLRFIASL
jgi:hypothetical protein